MPGRATVFTEGDGPRLSASTALSLLQIEGNPLSHNMTDNTAPRRRERSAARQTAARPTEARNPDRATDRATDRRAAREEKLAQQSWVEGAEPALPVRVTRPENVVFHLGPTNSGKTYESLQALAATGSGVYAAPLRQLA
ncbi:MAG: putative helicase, partial [Frankiales bacterium]|nr:putative helicase [Frankiales bacterium]